MNDSSATVQIEPMLGVQEQVIGSIVERKFENRKGLACRSLNIKSKMHEVDDGFRTRDLWIQKGMGIGTQAQCGLPTRAVTPLVSLPLYD
jgi:hypothetical protein